MIRVVKIHFGLIVGTLPNEIVDNMVYFPRIRLHRNPQPQQQLFYIDLLQPVQLLAVDVHKLQLLEAFGLEFLCIHQLEAVPEKALDPGRHLLVARDAGGVVVQAATSESDTYPLDSHALLHLGIAQVNLALRSTFAKVRANVIVWNRVTPREIRAGLRGGFMCSSVQLIILFLWDRCQSFSLVQMLLWSCRLANQLPFFLRCAPILRSVVIIRRFLTNIRLYQEPY